ncbi:MAG TPA: hypothetical protein VIG24_18700 [Acidimicrobiia bacterium]
MRAENGRAKDFAIVDTQDQELPRVTKKGRGREEGGVAADPDYRASLQDVPWSAGKHGRR